MKGLGLIFLLIGIIFSTTASFFPPRFGQRQKPSEPVKYVLTYPTLVKLSPDLAFNLVLFENVNYSLPVKFRALLTTGYSQTRQVLGEQTFTQETYGFQQHNFTVITSALLFSSPQNFSSPGLENETDVTMSATQMEDEFHFIQTDKAVYKPGQTVRFRGVFLNNQLMPLNGSVNVTVQDPKRNRIKQWINQTLVNGVFGASLVLSDYVNLGTWEISFASHDINSESKTFTVDRYVLPKYEVKLDFGSLSYWLFNGTSDSHYSGYVRAKYTFGKPVRGKASIRLDSTGYCNFSYDATNHYGFSYYGMRTSNNIKRLEVSTDLSGGNSETDGQFTLTGLNEIVKSTEGIRTNSNGNKPNARLVKESCTLQLSVNVTEELTGEVVQSSGSVTLHAQPYQIKEHDSVQKTLKLALPFTIRLQVSKPDGVPVGGEDVGVSVYLLTEEEQDFSACYTSYRSRSRREPNITATKTTDDNGLISMEVTPPAGIFSMMFKANTLKYPAVELCRTKSPPLSISKQAISIAIDRPISASTPIPTVGDTLGFTISASYEASFVYLLLSQSGNPFYYRKLDTPSSNNLGLTTFNVQVKLPQGAAPRCAAAVWTVENTAHEVLADAIEFQVNGLVKQNVSASFSPASVRPGSNVSLTVEATEKNSMIGLLAVDKSVKLLKSGNDISLGDVLNTVTYKSGSTIVTPLLWRCWSCGWWPSWLESSNAENVFMEIGMAIMSNALTQSDSSFPMYGDRDMAFGLPAVPIQKSTGYARVVRKEFPEVWIWLDSQNENGSLKLNLTAPDTITTWELSAFAIGPKTGFGGLQQPAELTVFQPFFVKLDIPYKAIIRNELFQIKAVVFNYESAEQKVSLILKKSFDFEISSDGGVSFAEKEFKTLVNVPAGDGVSISVWIKPKRLGEIALQLSAVSAKNASSSDAIEKIIVIEPEGETRYANRPIFVRLENRTNQDYNIDVAEMFGNISEELIVNGSKMFQLQAIGDLLGPSLTSLGSQVRMPTGCGEQTMVILAPNVNIYKYLKSVNALTSDLETKTKHFVEEGYQRELLYLRRDGGFSAFGASDRASSTWLTAFVLRCFHAAVKYVGTDIDGVILEKSWNYLKGKASADGTFAEPGKVLHHSMKGGATSVDNLAAYIYITYAEAGGSDSYAWKSFEATKSRLTAISSASEDPYQMALVAYAMSILPQDKRTNLSKQILGRLMSRATRESDLMYWQPSNDQSNIPEYSRSGPSKIETSAYVLLTLLNHGEVETAAQVARWLMSQRNSLGGFSSTQDTVVGLQALAEFASRLPAGRLDLSISASFIFNSGNPISTNFSINSSNSKLLLSYDLPRNRQDLNSVALSVEGTGVGLVQLALKYNIETQKEMDSGDYGLVISSVVMARKKRSADNSPNSTNSVLLHSCIRPVTSQAQHGMVIYELGIPTGFTAADSRQAKQPAGFLRRSKRESDYYYDYYSDSSEYYYDNYQVSNEPVNPFFEMTTPDDITAEPPSPPPPVLGPNLVELVDNKIAYYFDSLEGMTCIYTALKRTSLSKNVQPAVARVYSYYDPSRVNATLYTFEGISFPGIDIGPSDTNDTNPQPKTNATTSPGINVTRAQPATNATGPFPNTTSGANATVSKVHPHGPNATNSIQSATNGTSPSVSPISVIHSIGDDQNDTAPQPATNATTLPGINVTRAQPATNATGPFPNTTSGANATVSKGHPHGPNATDSSQSATNGTSPSVSPISVIHSIGDDQNDTAPQPATNATTLPGINVTRAQPATNATGPFPNTTSGANATVSKVHPHGPNATNSSQSATNGTSPSVSPISDIRAIKEDTTPSSGFALNARGYSVLMALVVSSEFFTLFY